MVKKLKKGLSATFKKHARKLVASVLFATTTLGAGGLYAHSGGHYKGDQNKIIESLSMYYTPYTTYYEPHTRHVGNEYRTSFSPKGYMLDGFGASLTTGYISGSALQGRIFAETLPKNGDLTHDVQLGAGFEYTVLSYNTTPGFGFGWSVGAGAEGALKKYGVSPFAETTISLNWNLHEHFGLGLDGVAKIKGLNSPEGLTSEGSTAARLRATVKF